MWKKEANTLDTKHSSAGRKWIFKTTTAPTLNVVFQNHTPDITKY